MAQTAKKLSNGMEKLHFLTDKTTRLVYQLQEEEKQLSELAQEAKRLRKKHEEIVATSSTLKEKLDGLEHDKIAMDSKVESLLEAINSLSPE